jgi:hypothetical protein
MGYFTHYDCIWVFLGLTKRTENLGLVILGPLYQHAQLQRPLFFLPMQGHQQPPHWLRTHNEKGDKIEDQRKERVGQTRNRSAKQRETMEGNEEEDIRMKKEALS